MRDRRAQARVNIHVLYGLYTWTIESDKFSITRKSGLTTKAGVRRSIRDTAKRFGLRIWAWKWED